jgi:hypothetical protein
MLSKYKVAKNVARHSVGKCTILLPFPATVFHPFYIPSFLHNIINSLIKLYFMFKKIQFHLKDVKFTPLNVKSEFYETSLSSSNPTFSQRSFIPVGYGRACAPVRCAHPSFWAVKYAQRGAARPPPIAASLLLIYPPKLFLRPELGPPCRGVYLSIGLSCTLLSYIASF